MAHRSSEIELAITSTALAGDAGGLYRIASELMKDGVPFDSVLFDYLMPTESGIGQRWQQGDYLIAEEHAATAAIETVVSLLAGMFDQPADATSIVVGTAEGDDHSLPARAAAAYLLFLGYRTTFLGANVPGTDFREFLEIDPPAAVVLSSAMTTHLMGAHSVITASHAVDIPILVGGKAFGNEGQWARALGADAWVGSLQDVAEELERLLSKSDIPLSVGVEFTPALESLRNSRTAVLANAEAALLEASGGSIDPRLIGEAHVLLSAIEASMLVNDDAVLADMLRWQVSTLGSSGYPTHLVANCIRSALVDVSADAFERLTRTGKSTGLFVD